MSTLNLTQTDSILEKPDGRPDKLNLDRDRRVLCVNSARFFPFDSKQLESANLAIELVAASSEAQERLKSEEFDAGLYVVPDHDSEIVRAEIEELLLADNQVLWTALLTRPQIETKKIASLISGYFFDYHTVPLDLNRLCITLGHACGMSSLSRRVNLTTTTSAMQDARIVGACPVIEALTKEMHKVAGVDAPVLIIGESGTGKELVAQGIHRQSWRSKRPFVPVNCGALPSSLIQAELFGHEKGAFTGAHRRRIGRFEAADRGTLFLDEIDDLPLELQGNLLRFLEEGTVERLGSSEAIAVDVRIVAATHESLAKAVEEGRFREDLYYRLNVLHIEAPALRERDGDIELLARYFLQLFSVETAKRVQGFSRDALTAMRRYRWPGNVRELINRVQRAVVMTDNQLITSADLGLASGAGNPKPTSLNQTRINAEKSAIDAALDLALGNATEAARDLGISRATLYRLMEKYGIGKQSSK